MSLIMLAALAAISAGQVEPVAAHQADEVRGRTLSWADAATLPRDVRADFDGDGDEDWARVNMTPHSFRHDVELVVNERGRTVIAAAQPNKGALVHRGIRLAQPGTYATACGRSDGQDVAPCAEGEVTLVNPGVDLYAPGGLRVLVWLDGDTPRVARLIARDVEP